MDTSTLPIRPTLFLEKRLLHLISEIKSQFHKAFFITTICLLSFAFSNKLIAQNLYEKTVCGFKVTTTVTYNSPNPGQTTFTWTVQNTNPGNGSGGTFQDLSHWSQKLDACVDPTKRVSGGSYGKDPSQDCLPDVDLLKFDEGTSGTTSKVYTAVFNGLDYAPVLVDAVFKSGSATPCCVGQIYGVGCCVVTPGAISGTDPVCYGGNPGVLGNATAATGNGIVTYQWQSSTTDCTTGFANINLATGATYDPPANATVTTYYRRVATNTLTASGATCSANSNCVTVTVNPLPTVNAVDKEVCAGQSVQLEGTPINGTWSSTDAPNAISGSSFSATGLAAGSYTVIYSYTDGNGCTNTDEAEVAVIAAPVIYSLTARDFCSGDAGLGRITLANSQTGVSYQLQMQDGANWNPVGNPEAGNTGNPIVWNTLAVGTYQVVSTGAAPTSCTSISGPATIDLLALPIVNPSANVACVNNVSTATISANASGGTGSYSYDWTVPQGATDPGNVASFTATVAGVYSVVVNDGNCSGAGSVTPVFGTCVTYQGCTPGYWKNHEKAWGCGYTGSTNFFAAFGIPTSPSGNLRKLSSSLTMLKAVDLGGGGYEALARHAVAGLLSACHKNVTYPYTMADVKEAVKNMFVNGTATLGGVHYSKVEALKNELDRANNLGCPLNNSNYLPSSITRQSEVLTPVDDAEFSVQTAPNPYRDRIRLNIQSKVSGQGSLEIFNLMGQRVKTLYQGRIEAGQTRTIDYAVPMADRTDMIYILRVGDKLHTGKIMKQQ